MFPAPIYGNPAQLITIFPVNNFGTLTGRSLYTPRRARSFGSKRVRRRPGTSRFSFEAQTKRYFRVGPRKRYVRCIVIRERKSRRRNNRNFERTARVLHISFRTPGSSYFAYFYETVKCLSFSHFNLRSALLPSAIRSGVSTIYKRT